MRAERAVMGFAIRHDDPGSEYYCATDYSMQRRLMYRASLLSDESNVESLPRCRMGMNWSGKRTIVACLLTAALGLMLCPPWLGAYHHGHRLLWNGRGNLDWSRLALELCLLAIIGALAAVVAPMVERPSGRAPKVWFRRAGLGLGCAAVLILVATAGYDGIIRFALLHDYNKKVQEFQAKGSLLQEAFPLYLQPTYQGFVPVDWDKSISNVHEAEIMLRSVGCDDRSIQRAMALFLSASKPEYNKKTLIFDIRSSGGKGADCLPKGDIFDQLAADQKASPKVKWGDEATPPPPPGFTLDEPTTREIVFDFRIETSDAAKRFFAPLPDWYAEALQHNIEVARVPDWMKPGEPPATWSFTEWLDSRSPWLILTAVMLALSVLCFVVASRIDRTMAGTNSSVGGVRSDEGVL